MRNIRYMIGAHRLEIGSKIGPYKIIRLLGKGGMGEVYEVYEESLHRKIALKIVSDVGDEESVSRFFTEGKALARVNHPNIVHVYRFGESDGIHYIAMEYAEGKSLGSCIQVRGISHKKALALFLQLLSAVSELHKNKIIHRDLKPNNIIYKEHENTVKIIDFGIAKVADDDDLNLTKTGTILGSIKYIAPEVAYGGPVTVKSDIWSLGVMFFEMLVGKYPFGGTTQFEVFDNIRNHVVKFPILARKLIPKELQAVVLKMCEKDQQRRYKTIDQIILDLKPLENENTGPVMKDLRISNEKEIIKYFTQWGLGAEDIGLALNFVQEQQLIKDLSTPGSHGESETILINSDVIDKTHHFVTEAFEAAKNPDPEEAMPTTRILLGVKDEKDEVEESKIIYLDSKRSEKEKAKNLKPTLFWTFAIMMGVGLSSWRYLLDFPRERPSQVAQNKVEIKNVPSKGQKRSVSSVPNQGSKTTGTPLDKPSSGKAEEANKGTGIDQAMEKKVVQPLQIKKKSEQIIPTPNKWVKKTPKPRVKKLGVPRVVKSDRHVTLSFPKRLPGRNLASVVRNIVNPPRLNWKSVKSAESYEIQISNQKDFSQREVSKMIRGTSYVWYPKAPGKYYWRVRSAAKRRKRSGFSRTQGLSVELPSPVLHKKYNKSVTIKSLRDLNGSSKKVQLVWNPVPMAQGYSVVVSDSPKFKRGKRTIASQENRIQLGWKNSGKYYMKVAATDQNGKLAGKYSAVTEVNFKKKLKMAIPVTRVPANGTKILSVRNVAPPVAFSWNSVAMASSYKLEFSSDRNFKRVIFSTSPKKNNYLLSKSLPGGRIYWRVRAERGSHYSGWTGAKYFVYPKTK